MADIFETVEQLARGVQERLTARTAYGEPVSANGVTVVPVAKVRFGFGGGGGGGSGAQAEQSGAGGGGGGGGGGLVEPLGFIEISDLGARWVPVEPSRAELVLRALMATAVIAPGGGRGGFFRRLFLLLAGQAAVSQLTRPRLPPLPEELYERRAVAEPA
jgi:uncharacterized spore protein YtfJ